MIEFSAQTGGRYTYVDDIINLQELALAFSAFFSECDNFIIGGCEITGNQISSGYIYINGKIRYFQGKSEISQWPQYIYESNSNINVNYASGGAKVGRTNYGCAIGNSVPTAQDPVTGKTPSFIRISQTEAPRLRDSFIGKYALTLDTILPQIISSPVTFKELATASKGLSLKGKLNLASGNSKAEILVEGDNLVVRNQVSNGVIREMLLTSDAVIFYANKQAVITITDNQISFNKPIISTEGQIANIKIDHNNIYDKNTQGDNGSVYINSIGYNGGNSYFRNTYIGDGKQSNIIEIFGKTKTVNVKAKMTIETNDNTPFVLKSLFTKDSESYKPTINWTDNSNYVTATLGFNHATKGNMALTNNLGDIVVWGKQAVDLGPIIKENGVPLSQKYALKEEATKDTGWVFITQGLYARQIGNIVCIQGTIRTIHSGILFTLPNNISAPKHDVVFCSGDYYVWRTRIKGGQKTCRVEYCSSFCGQTEGFSLTYMV